MKEDITLEEGLRYSAMEAGKRAIKLAQLLMLPESAKGAFVQMMVGEFLNGATTATQLGELIEKETGVSHTYSDITEALLELSEELGFSHSPIPEADAALDKVLENHKVPVELSETLKSFLDVLPDELREAARAVITKMLEDGTKPEDLHIQHIQKSMGAQSKSVKNRLN